MLDDAISPADWSMNDPAASPDGWSGTPSVPGAVRYFSRFAEIGLLLLMCAMLLEGVFFRYIEAGVTQETAAWARIAPFRAFPSEMIFYGLVTWIGGAWIALHGRRNGFRTARSFGLFSVFLGVGVIQAVHGWFAGAPGHVWLAEFRQLFLGSIFAALFSIVGPEVRLWKVAGWYVRFAIVMAVVNAVMGALVLVGIGERSGPMEPYWSGDMLLVLAYLFVLMRGVYFARLQPVIIAILAVGILMPLQKPTISMFVVAHILIFLALRTYRCEGQGSLMPLFKAMFVVGIALSLFVALTQLIGGSAAQEWLAMRFFKVGTNSEDLSSGRFDAWSWAFSQFLANPLLGTGLGFQMVYSSSAAGEVRYLNVHNLTLSWLYQTGIVCFLVLISTLFLWVTRIAKFLRYVKSPTELWPLVAAFVWVCSLIAISQVGQTLGVFSLGSIFWVFIGILSGIEAQHHVKAQHLSQLEYYSSLPE